MNESCRAVRRAERTVEYSVQYCPVSTSRSRVHRSSARSVRPTRAMRKGEVNDADMPSKVKQIAVN